jgi:hypothetical protein
MQDTRSPFVIYDEDVYRMLMHSHDYPLPKNESKLLNFQAAFKSCLGTLEAVDLVENLQRSRKSFENHLSSSPTSLKDVENHLNIYLQHLLQANYSLSHQPEVFIGQFTLFEWKGSFSLPDAPMSRFVEFTFELIMALHTLVCFNSSNSIQDNHFRELSVLFELRNFLQMTQ